MPAGLAYMTPGLYNRTGAWAICHGLFMPRIYVDPQTPSRGGHNALVAHEACHAKQRHRLRQLLWLFVPALGWLIYPFSCRKHEAQADAAALQMFGHQEFHAFLTLHKNPTTWWGKFKYGATKEERKERAMRAAMGRTWKGD